MISVDYRMPPDAPYPAARGRRDRGVRAMSFMQKPQNMAVFGTSTGGGMTLALMPGQAEHLALPAAMGLGTPWSDLTETGDSYSTNEWLDNVLVSYSGYLTPAAKLYAPVAT
ncbi:alpha/beta hydrolase fold domain-containing protein [Streptomyces sp. L7]